MKGISEETKRPVGGCPLKVLAISFRKDSAMRMWVRLGSHPTTLKHTLIPLFGGVSKFPVCPGLYPSQTVYGSQQKVFLNMLTVVRSLHNEELKDKDLEAQTGQ